MKDEEDEYVEDIDETIDEDEDGEPKELAKTKSKKSKSKVVKEKEEEKLPKFEKLDPQVRFALTKIKEYLEDLSIKDELFAKKYPNEAKPLVKCWIYICKQAEKDKNKFYGGAVPSDYMFRKARDFYNDDLDPKESSGEVASGNVMTENAKEDEDYKSILTDEDKAKIKQKAELEYADEIKRKLAANAEKQKQAQIKVEEKAKEKVISNLPPKDKTPVKQDKKELKKHKTYEELPLFKIV